jgi:hypothetical protein
MFGDLPACPFVNSDFEVIVYLVDITGNPLKFR